jgi:hypothetical protein
MRHRSRGGGGRPGGEICACACWPARLIRRDRDTATTCATLISLILPFGTAA